MPSIIGGALAGLGEQMANIGARQMQGDIDLQNRSALQSQESDLATQRAKALELFKRDLAEAPMRRLSQKAGEYAKEDVPESARPADSLSGNLALNPGEMGPPDKGFVGDLSVVRNAIATMPDGPDKQRAIAQYRSQFQADQADAQNAVVGKTRRRTSDEALAAAVNDAKANDLPAFAQYEKELGKPARDERRVAVQEQREDNRAAASAASEARKAEQEARRYEVDMKRLDLQAGSLEANNRKIDAWIENEADKRERDANKDGSKPERLYSIINSMNQTIKNLQDSPKGKTEDERNDWKRQYDTAVRVRDRASAALDGMLKDRDNGSAPALAAPSAAATASRPALSTFMKK